jgi:CubicO group peptidase (beta-lactamase class C family)
MSRWRRRLLLSGLGVASAALLLGVAWSMAIGPVAVWRIITNGTTTVWDHRDYPGRSFGPSPEPSAWPMAHTAGPTAVETDEGPVDLDGLLRDTDSLAAVVVVDGEIVYEWYRSDHAPTEPSMLFSVSKSVLSLLIGAAIDDGYIDSVRDPVATYVPELSTTGLGEATIQSLLRMDSNLDYVEGDNPFGIHVEFNYTDDLTSAILGLDVRGEPDATFRYKSGDNAVLGLMLERALGNRSITSYFAQRLWGPLGAESGGIWSTDRTDGLERTWCCLAVTARDLARLGQLVLDDGVWSGERVLSADWLAETFSPAYPPERWPVEYRDTPLINYGYQWWLTEAGARVALGKDGQYLYVDPTHRVVVVRLGEGRGDVSWLDVFDRITRSLGS